MPAASAVPSGRPPRAMVPACRAVLARTTCVRVPKTEVEAYAQSLDPEDLRVTIAESSSSTPNFADAHLEVARIVAYNVVNFSFYPERGGRQWTVEYDGEVIGEDDEAFAIVACLKRHEAKIGCNPWNNAAYLQALTLQDVEAIFEPRRGAGVLPLLELRHQCLIALGKAWETLGGVAGLLLAADHSAVKFCELLATHCPPFHDRRAVDPAWGWGEEEDLPAELRQPIEFAKRPQLACSMIHADKLYHFSDMEELTVYADYRLPQLFRALGLLELNEDGTNSLARRWDAMDEIPEGSEEEVAIRCATIVIAEDLRLLLQLSAVDSLDYYLWKTTVRMEKDGMLRCPHHRTRGVCY